MCVCRGAGAASEADFTTCTPRPLRRSHQVLMQREHVSGLAPSALVQIEGDNSRQREEKWSGTAMDKRETLSASWEELEVDWAKGFSDQGSEANDDVKILWESPKCRLFFGRDFVKTLIINVVDGSRHL